MKLEVIAKRGPNNAYVLTCPRFRNLEAIGNTPSDAVTALRDKVSSFVEQELSKAFHEAEVSLQELGGVNGNRLVLPIKFFL